MITLSCDDGCASDVRVAELALVFGLKCIFYWPVEWNSLAYANGYKPLTFPEAMSIAKSNEIGSHTITHRHLTKISLTDAVYEIVESKLILQRMFPGNTISAFCPPRGYITDQLTGAVIEFYESMRLTKGGNLVHVHPDSGANNNKAWQYVAREKLNKLGSIELWFHSWELDKFNLWGELEEFLRYG